MLLKLLGALALAMPLAAAEPLKIDARLDRPVLTDRGGDVVLRLNLEGLRRPGHRRPPLNLVLVVDRSGSMSGDKIENAKAAARQVVDRLGKDDVLALVGFDDRVQVFYPAQRLKSPSAAYEAIDSLQPGGSTALYAGVQEGLKQARRNLGEGRPTRVILLSDGLANVGPSSPQEVAQLGRAAGKDGITISTLGLGLGYDEDLLTRLAQASDGNHAFIAEARDLPRILDRELGDALAVAARDIIIEIRLKRGVRYLRSLDRELEADGDVLRLRLNQVAEGQAKQLLLVLQAPEGKAGQASDLADVVVKAADAEGGQAQAWKAPLAVSYSADEASVARAEDKDIKAEAAKAKANEARVQAIQLRDAGKADEARALLKREASALKSASAGASAPAAAAAEAFSQDLEQESEALAAPEGDWNAARKSMSQKAYSTRNQQTY